MGKLTDLQKIEAVEEYLSGATGEELATKYGVRSQSIYALLKVRGIPKRHRQYQVDEDYFDSIDSVDKAYWLGFLFAEGSLDTHRYTLSTKIGSFDRYHLDAFRVAINSEHPIKPASDRDAVVLKIGSKRLSNRLKTFGFGPGKAVNIRMPELEPHLIRHFIRGFFDGDGWLSRYENGSLMVGFASCSKPILESFQEWFSEKTGRKTGSIICRKRSHIPNQNDNFRLQYNGRSSPVEVLDLMYNGATVGLARKMNIYQIERMNQMNTEYSKGDIVKTRDGSLVEVTHSIPKNHQSPEIVETRALDPDTGHPTQLVQKAKFNADDLKMHKKKDGS